MIFLGSDHAGFELKESINDYLTSQKNDFMDLGPLKYVKTDDYPDYAFRVAKRVAENPSFHRGIIMCGTGQGCMITANKVPQIRAVLYYGGPLDLVVHSRQHNNSNILSLPGGNVNGRPILSPHDAISAVDLWLKTPFSQEERHERRIDKIRQIEDIL